MGPSARRALTGRSTSAEACPERGRSLGGVGQPLGGAQIRGRGSSRAGPTSDPTPASFLPPPQKERERDGGRESGVLWKGAEGGEGKKEKGTETWRSVVRTVSPRAAPRHRSSRPPRPRPASLWVGSCPLCRLCPWRPGRAQAQAQRGHSSPGPASEGCPGRVAGAFSPQEATVSDSRRLGRRR